MWCPVCWNSKCPEPIVGWIMVGVVAAALGGLIVIVEGAIR